MLYIDTKRNNYKRQSYSIRPEVNIHNTTIIPRCHILLTKKIHKTKTVTKNINKKHPTEEVPQSVSGFPDVH